MTYCITCRRRCFGFGPRLFRPLSHYGACLFCVLFKYALNLPTSGIT